MAVADWQALLRTEQNEINTYCVCLKHLYSDGIFRRIKFRCASNKNKDINIKNFVP